MNQRLPRIVLFLTTFLMSVVSSADAGGYGDRDDARQFAREMAERDGFTEEGILFVLGQAQYKQSIIDAISRPAEKVLTWAEYQDIFLTRKRIAQGREFMFENATALQDAYDTYGVPPVIITAIIGVETMYGRNRGNYRVLDALATLAFDYPPRSSFFRKELRQFILLVREEEQSITELKGSYAGAMGYGQFIPSSYRHYSVDFNGDGNRDIWNDKTDAIGSVANYFSEHGWRKGELIVAAVAEGSLPKPAEGSLSGAAEGSLSRTAEGSTRMIFNQSLKPTTTVAEMARLGFVSPLELAGDLAVSPMRLAGKQGDEYWLGLHNFYVITRYNHSKLYAMAIYQLSEALRRSDEVAYH